MIAKWHSEHARLAIYALLIAFAILVVLARMARISGREPSAKEMIALVGHTVREAIELDEELITVVCILLFSLSLSRFVVRQDLRRAFRRTYPVLLGGLALPAAALVVGMVARKLVHSPVDKVFHVAYSIAVLVLYWRVLVHTRTGVKLPEQQTPVPPGSTA